MKRSSIVQMAIHMVVVFFVFMFGTEVFAHPFSQEGILAKTYVGHSGIYYDNYFIGGDTVGWRIHEARHTNGTTLTYYFLSGPNAPTEEMKAQTRDGARLWNGTVTIRETNDTSGTGVIRVSGDLDTDVCAECCNLIPSNDGTGHLTSWSILLNPDPNVTVDDITLAHEFGHAIGLVDLYASKSTNKLMYGARLGRTATGPTNLDKWGAKVITGVHTTHTWGYRYYDTTSAGANRHVKYCTQCNGNSTVVANCAYNAQNICKVCGVAYGTTPYSVGAEVQ